MLEQVVHVINRRAFKGLRMLDFLPFVPLSITLP
jgi:hypothetical protein